MRTGFGISRLLHRLRAASRRRAATQCAPEAWFDRFEARRCAPPRPAFLRPRCYRDDTRPHGRLPGDSRSAAYDAFMFGWADSNWLRVVGYLFVAALCFVGARREDGESEGSWPPFWVLTGALFVVMAIGRAGDIADLVTNALRERAVEGGWYTFTAARTGTRRRGSWIHVVRRRHGGMLAGTGTQAPIPADDRDRAHPRCLRRDQSCLPPPDRRHPPQPANGGRPVRDRHRVCAPVRRRRVRVVDAHSARPSRDQRSGEGGTCRLATRRARASAKERQRRVTLVCGVVCRPVGRARKQGGVAVTLASSFWTWTLIADCLRRRLHGRLLARTTARRCQGGTVATAMARDVRSATPRGLRRRQPTGYTPRRLPAKQCRLLGQRGSGPCLNGGAQRWQLE